MEPTQLRRAVEAARSAATGLGLAVGDVVVVNDSDRVALRLTGCDVLARVAPAAHRAESAFEVDVARRLTAVDAPVAELHPGVEPGPHVRDGFVVSFWTYYAPVGAEITPADFADGLARQHAALRRIDLDAPHFTDRTARAVREVEDSDRSPGLPDADRALLVTALRDVSAEVGAVAGREQLLHGEPHPGNLITTRRGPLFVDLATCCRGPVEFDLAHAPEDVADHYAGADRALVDRCRALNWAMFCAWRWRHDDRFPDRDRQRQEGLRRVRSALTGCEPPPAGREGGQRLS